MESDGEFIDIELRPAAEVARRCLVLSALLQRVALSANGDIDAEDDREGAAFDLREWLRGENLWDVLTTAEAEVFTRPIETEVPAALDSLSLGEPLATLAWCLGLVSSIAPHMASDIAILADEIPTPWESASSWIANQHLRPESEIAIERERAELWEWRLATEYARREAPFHDRGQNESDIRDVTYEAEEAGLLDPEDALGAYEVWQAIRDFEDEAVASWLALAEHRLRALNWVCGFGESWDDVPLDI